MNHQFSLLHHQLYAQALPAQQLLEDVQACTSTTPEQQEYKAYLLGWSYVLAQHWETAVDALRPLLPSTFVLALSGGSSSERVRYAHCLLCLGRAAASLRHWDDASQHLAASLSLLRGTRAGSLAFEARQLAGYVFLQQGMGEDALREYTVAARYGTYARSLEWRADLMEGRSIAYQLMGSFSKMRREAQRALDAYTASGNRVEQARMWLFLAEWSMREAPHKTLTYVEHGIEAAAETTSSELLTELYLIASQYFKESSTPSKATLYDDRACFCARMTGDEELLACALLESCTTLRLLAEQADPQDGCRTEVLRQARSRIEEAVQLSQVNAPDLLLDVRISHAAVIEALALCSDAA